MASLEMRFRRGPLNGELCGSFLHTRMKNVTVTEEGLERFLNWLDADRELAALKYEKLRRSLVAYFAKRQCAAAEDLADLALDAAMDHLLKQNSLLLTKSLPYIFGIARNLYRQYLNKQVLSNGEANWNQLPAQDLTDENSEKERRSGCLRKCLRELKGEDRRLFQRYYLQKNGAMDQYRLELAEEFGLTINALRLKMMRLREQLRLCIKSCLQRASV